MSTLHDPHPSSVIHPLPPQAPESRWQELNHRMVPPWIGVALVPIAAIVAGGALASLGTP